MVDARFKKSFEKGERQRASGDHEGAFAFYQDCLGFVDKSVAPRAYAVAAFRLVRMSRVLERDSFARELLSELADDDVLPSEIRLESFEIMIRLLMDFYSGAELIEAAERALALAGATEAHAVKARIHGNLGVLALRDTDWNGARHNFLLSAEGFGAVDDIEGQAEAWTALGEVAAKTGGLDEAFRFFEDAFRALVDHQSFARASVPRAAMGHILRRRGQSREALRIFEEVCAVNGRQGNQVSGTFVDLAAARMDLGDWVSAEGALNLARKNASNAVERAKVSYLQADWLVEMGSLKRALEVVEEAAGDFGRVRDLRGRAAARMMADRIRWRLGEEAPPSVEVSSLQALPDLQISYNAHMAERLFSADCLQEASDIAGSLARSGDSPEDRLQGMKTEAYLLFMRWMLCELDAEQFSAATLRIAQGFSGAGNIRQAVGVALAPIPFLLLRGESISGAQLLDFLRGMEREIWPQAWRRALVRCGRVLALVRGARESRNDRGLEAEELTSRLLDQVLERFENGREEEIAALFEELDSSGRNLWSRLLKCFF